MQSPATPSPPDLSADAAPKEPWCCAERRVFPAYQRCVHLLAFRQANGLDTLRTLQQCLQSLNLSLRMRSVNPLYQLRGIPLPQCVECKRLDGIIHVCAHCVFAGCLDAGHIQKHALDNKHSITVEVESNEMYCHRCRDYVYDLDYEALVHEERLRAELRVAGVPVHRVPSQALTSKVQVSSAFLAHGVPSKTLGLRGLMNLGNTCFMNCILQSFIHNPFMQRYFLADKHNRSLCERKGSLCLGCEMDNLFAEAYSGMRIPFTPDHFLHTMWQFSQYFAGYEQQDAHEFLIAILNGIHTHCGGSLDDSQCSCIVHKVFSGVMRSKITCSTCQTASATDELFFDVSLDLPKTDGKATKATAASGATAEAAMDVEAADGGEADSAGDKDKENAGEAGEDKDGDGAKEKAVESSSKSEATISAASSDEAISLTSCMKRFTSPERLRFEERFRCGKCDAYRECVKQLSFKTLPLVLCFHLKRFESGATKRSSMKVDDFVEFHEDIDMWEYTSRAMQAREQPGCGILPVKQLYRLFCVIIHAGRMDNGHYYCYSRHPEGGWIRCEDAYLTKASEEDVKKQQAYLLFYVRRNIDYNATL